jgi:hypothetical protein
MPERPTTLRGLLIVLLRHAPQRDLAEARDIARATSSTDAYADLALLIESAADEALREKARQARRGE